MAPPFTFGNDEKVLCFHHEQLYEAKVLDAKLSDDPTADKKGSALYRIHYKGWKNTWDDWVPETRLRKYNTENRELANNIKKDLEAQRKAVSSKSMANTKVKKVLGSEFSSTRDSEERSSVPAMGRGQKRGRDNEIEKEEAFHSRPSVRLPVPDTLKSILVDDWENVTKNLQLVSLPSKYPVNSVMDEYFEEEKGRRTAGSAEVDLLEEVIAGIKEYFDKALGRALLYRFERQQFFELRKLLESGDPKWEGKSIGDIYGVEHLSRLLVKLPELIAQTNMDQPAVARLKEELMKMTNWIIKNEKRLFAAPYEATSTEYANKARTLA